MNTSCALSAASFPALYMFSFSVKGSFQLHVVFLAVAEDVICAYVLFYALVHLVNSGDYVQAVCDRNLAENISRVLYPNDNVNTLCFHFLFLVLDSTLLLKLVIDW
jgi:hypothetical protein